MRRVAPVAVPPSRFDRWTRRKPRQRANLTAVTEDCSSVRVEDMLRPRIKPEHVPYRTVDGNIRIGATVHGIGVEINDPDGFVWVLIGALNGTRSPDEVCAAVQVSHPGVPAAVALQQLSDA